MRILLTNQHGNNRGDESAVIGLIESIYKIVDKNAQITILKQSGEYRFITENYPIQEKSMIVSLKGLIEMTLWILFRLINLDIRKILSRKFNEFINLHEESDLILSSCGGPYIGDIYINHEIIHICHLVVPLLLNKKVAFAAPSMGPFNVRIMNPLRRILLQKVDLIILRDPVSYKYVLDFGINPNKVFVTADACFAHCIDVKSNVIKEKNIIGITPLKYNYPNTSNKKKMQSKYEETVVKTLNNLMDEDKELKVEFFPQLYGKHSDLPLINDIVGRLKYPERAIIFSNKLSGPMQQKEIAGLKAMIATRYHSAVFAIKMCVPCICIAYEHKAKGLMESVGLKEYLLDIYTVTEQDILSKMELIKVNYLTIQKIMEVNSKKLMLEGQQTIRIIKDRLLR